MQTRCELEFISQILLEPRTEIKTSALGPLHIFCAAGPGLGTERLIEINLM
jgi:hypothetical protein